MASIKIRDNNGLTITPDIKKEFPSIFNHRRSTRVSEDYQMYRSDQVIELMEQNGLKLVEIGQERMGWSQKRQPHTQIHTMRFHSLSTQLKDFGVGDSVPEIVVMNSHDGRCLFRAMAGVFRLVCSNGMIVADQQFGTIARRHYGEANAFAKVKEIIADMPRVVNLVSERIADWSALELDRRAQLALARLMMKDRAAPEWLLPEQVLEHRRELEAPNADGVRSLWSTFNVAQEALTNAEVHRLSGEGRARSIRPINGTVGNVGVNQKLWATAEAYFDAKVERMKPAERERFEAARAAASKRTSSKSRKAKVDA